MGGGGSPPSTCDTPQPEICGNGVDEDCNGLDAECPIGTGDCFYLDAAVATSGDGSSWATAWKEPGDVDWSALGPGTTLYVSGGTSGQSYSGTLVVEASGALGQPVVIARATDADHDGPVTFDGGNATNAGVSVRAQRFVRITGLRFTGYVRDIEISGESGSSYSEQGAASYVVVDHTEIDMTAGRGVFVQTSDHVFVRDNLMSTPSFVDAQTDGIYSQRNHLNIYERNDIRINNEETEGHDDGIQLFEDTDITVRSNYVEQHNDKSGNAQGIYATTMYGTSIFTNNVVNLGNAQSNGLAFRRLTGTGTVEIVGNTVYSIRAYHTAEVTETPDPIVRNNVFVTMEAGNSLTLTDWAGDPQNVDYNLYFNPTSEDVLSLNGTGRTLAELQGDGLELHGLNADPGFVSTANRDFHVGPGSPVVDAGLALGDAFAFDKEGTPRPQGGGWDIGAFER